MDNTVEKKRLKKIKTTKSDTKSDTKLDKKSDTKLDKKSDTKLDKKSDTKLDKKSDVKTDDSINYLKPVIKWVGGKTQIIDDVIKSFPNKMDNYHELFTGGGSVLIALLQNIENKKITVKNKIYAYDLNETLIHIYKNIQKNPDKLIIDIKKLIDDYNSIVDTKKNRKPTTIEEAKSSKESYYYWIRNAFNEMSQDEQNSTNGSAHFIFLNKTCFRGLYREGPHGFNVPYGNYKSPEIINEEHIKNISKLIKNVEFICSDFEDSIKNVKKHDFMYADPPYVPENAKSFVGYTSDGFKLEKHKVLFDLLKKNNFVMSNSDTDLVKNSFNDKEKFDIKIISCRRAINSKKPDSKTNEVLIKSL
jgi:DNA adenine methylase